MIERGYSPFVVIRPENDASRNLYTKLGYQKAFETVRVTLQPTSITNGCNGKLNGHANGHHVDIKTNQTNGDTKNDDDAAAADAAAATQPMQNGNQNKVADAKGINTSDELQQWSKSVRIVWFRFLSDTQKKWKKKSTKKKIALLFIISMTKTKPIDFLRDPIEWTRVWLWFSFCSRAVVPKILRWQNDMKKQKNNNRYDGISADRVDKNFFLFINPTFKLNCMPEHSQISKSKNNSKTNNDALINI